jgi:hypothetical protein
LERAGLRFSTLYQTYYLQYWNSINPFYSAFLFYSLIFIGNFFLINLFLGVINYTFDKIMIEHEIEELRQTNLLRKKTLLESPVPGLNLAISGLVKKTRGKRIASVHDESGANILEASGMLDSPPATVSPIQKEGDPSEKLSAAINEQKDDSEQLDEPLKTVVHKAQAATGCEKACARLLISPYFTILRLLASLVNTVSLAMIQYPEKQSETKALFYINIGLTLFFLVENIVLLIGEGFRNYIREIFPIFDLLLSVVSRLEVYK